MARDDIFDFAGIYFAVGLSSVVGLTVTAGLNASVIKHISGGSLLMNGTTYAAGVSGIGSSGIGYLFSVGEAFSLNRSCTLNLWAVGATALVTVGDGKTTPVGI